MPPLLWFGHLPWAIIHTDAPRYLLAGSELVSGGGLDSPAGISNYNGGHGPVFPALIGSLILILGRDTESLVWTLRLLALFNPLLAYFLAKLSRIPPDALWVQMMGRCRVISLSMPNLLEQVRQSSSDYVLITGSGVSPSILRVPSLLQESGAFEVVHAEGRSGTQGVVLLRSTGRAPEAVPTLVTRSTAVRLKRCEQAKGQKDSSWLRSTFPHGISEVTASG